MNSLLHLTMNCAVLLVTPIAAHAAAPPHAALGSVDFRYAPPWWQTAICLPDDADKTLVGKEGQLLFDFGGGGVRNFGICLQPETDGAKWVRQGTVSARAPIVQTWKDAAGVEVLEETFIVPPESAAPAAPARLARTDGQGRQLGWAKPARVCAPAFTGADVGRNGRTIRLLLAVPAGQQVTVVFGLCEGWHKEPGKRPLVLGVEGGESRTVDPVRDFGANQPGLYRLTAQDADRDGFIEVTVATPEGAEDRNPILNALWAFDGPPPDEESILTGTADASALATLPGSLLPERRAVVLVTLKNPAAAAATRQPVLRIQTPAPTRLNTADQSVNVGGGTRITASEPIALLPAGGDQFLVRLPAMTLQPGATRQVAFTVDRHAAKPGAALSTTQALRLRDAAQRWWEEGNLPFDTIQVPDAGIQAMIESCVRNIWQAREIKKGQPAFHVGPTVYRNLWTVDGAFLLESAALVGRGQDARAGIEYLLSHQKPDGSFDILGDYWKENGIVLWTATRHAFLTQDKRWLQGHWPALQRVVRAVEDMRIKASKDPSSLEYRLLPPGQIDGGIWNTEKKPEYTNVYWCLGGLKAAIAAAQWLGDETSAAAWQKEFDDFYATYRKAAARDTLKDRFGNAYVPTMMGNIDNHAPERGQWAFCHAVYPGQVFTQDDPLVESQLAMLRATMMQGMVYDTGWMKEGIWTYFASFYGHAELWQGRGREAAQALYSFANHACPTRVWREEQKPVSHRAEEVGDMPHNWASAEFIRLATHLLQLDRGDELHLLEGFPREWAAAGMVTRLNGVLTPFGPLHMTVEAAKDGKTATLTVEPLGANCRAVVVHLPDGSVKQVSPQNGGTLTFPLSQEAH
ncbi:MAG: hypothetical protein FJ276_01010 [Planctomycetes bacterium]|nr:hypothetical protein [Planctomycetota bacterium]